MAGDWIKLQNTTPDKPEVFRMAMDLGIAPEHVVGCLVRLWIWADQQSLQGNGISVTGVTLDRITCNAGFAQALKNVGWLTGDDGNYTLPNFDRHNGNTAKTRANTKKRVETHRALQSNAPSVTREEKRREDKTTKAAAIALPDWIPLSAWNDWVDMRKKSGKAPTPRALELAITELQKLRASGNDPAAVLEQSTFKNYTGLFEVKGAAAAKNWQAEVQ